MWFLLNVALGNYKEAKTFSHWSVQGVSWEDSYAHAESVASIGMNSVDDCVLKTRNE